MIEQVWYCICMNVVESTDEEKKAVAEVMKMLYKESAIRKKLLDVLVLFSEQERKKHSDWRKGQALCSCASIAFPHIVNSKILKSDADCYYDDSKIQEFLYAVDDYLTESKPLVGIFWFYYGLPLFVHAVPLEQGLRYDKAVTGTKDHAEYWDELGKGSCHLNVLPPRLREEYFSIPRGRVVYHEDTGLYTIYHGNNLGEHDLQKVAAVFCLPSLNHVRFEKDIHYCDLSDEEWERMFR